MKTTNMKFIKESLSRTAEDFFIFAKTTDGKNIMISDIDQVLDDEGCGTGEFTASDYSLDKIETILSIESKSQTASEISYGYYPADKSTTNTAPSDLVEKVKSGFVAVELEDGLKGWIVEYDDSHEDEYGEAKVCIEFLNSQYRYIFVSNIAKITNFIQF